MAGYWIKFDTSTPDKPEVWAIANQLSIDPDAVVGKLLRVWTWFDDHSEKGNAASVTKALLDRKVGVTGFCDSMVSVGWLLESENEISIPNFDRHNGKTAKTRVLTASRVAAHKKSNATGNAKGNAKGNAASVTNALPRREEKRREEINKKDDGDGKVLMEFPIRGGGIWELKESLAATLREAYPAIDRRSEYTKAKAWLVANPESQKTPRGMGKFLNAWLARCKPEPQAPPRERVPSGEELSRRSREQMAAREAARAARKTTEEVA